MIATRAEGWLVFCSLGCSNDVFQSTSEQKKRDRGGERCHLRCLLHYGECAFVSNCVLRRLHIDLFHRKRSPFP